MSFKLSVVYNKITPEVKQEIIDLWLSAGVLSKADAEKRVNDVVVIARDENNKIAGVTSVEVKGFQKPGSLYYFFRMYVVPDHRARTIPRKSPIMSNLTIDFLSTYETIPKPKGVIAVLDNPKLTERIMQTFGWNYYGVGPIGKSIWYKNFDGSTMKEKLDGKENIDNGPTGIR